MLIICRHSCAAVVACKTKRCLADANALCFILHSHVTKSKTNSSKKVFKHVQQDCVQRLEDRTWWWISTRLAHQFSWSQWRSTEVINRWSADPWGSAEGCQGVREQAVKNTNVIIKWWTVCFSKWAQHSIGTVPHRWELGCQIDLPCRYIRYFELPEFVSAGTWYACFNSTWQNWRLPKEASFVESQMSWPRLW